MPYRTIDLEAQASALSVLDYRLRGFKVPIEARRRNRHAQQIAIREVEQAVKDGATYAACAAQLGISTRTLERWRRREVDEAGAQFRAGYMCACRFLAWDQGPSAALRELLDVFAEPGELRALVRSQGAAGREVIEKIIDEIEAGRAE